jgi:hypothetical protein
VKKEMGRICALLLAVIVVIPALFICCAGEPEIMVTEFYVTPSPVTQGDTGTLRWNVSGATEASIDNGIGSVPLSGAVDIKPAGKSVYTLTAKNSGRSVQKPLIVEVNPRPSTTVQAPQIPVISALDTSLLLSNAGKEVIVEGNITYISSWLPTRFRGEGSGFPWTFMFFMKDVLEGSADNAGVGEYCPECWRDYTSFFRAIIKPEYLSAVLPTFSNIYGGNFYINAQGLIIGATAEGKLFFLQSPTWTAGFIITNPVQVRIQGIITNYLSAPVIYLTNPAQISAVRL